MANRLINSSWRLLAVLLIALPAFYVASFGPACWLTRGIHPRLLSLVYRPVFQVWAHGPRAASDWIMWYGNLGHPSVLLVEGEARDWLRQ